MASSAAESVAGRLAASAGGADFPTILREEIYMGTHFVGASAMAGTILARDVGGTKTHLGLYRADGPELMLLREPIYATRDFAGLEPPVAAFLGGVAAAGASCVGVPGPAVDR